MAGAPHILIVEDDLPTAERYRAQLEAAGVGDIEHCTDSREVAGRIERRLPDVMLLDLKMPHIHGKDLLDTVSVTHPEIAVIVITAEESVETAVECMKMGAFDYLTKPVEPHRLLSSVRNVLKIRGLERELSSVANRIGGEGLQRPETFSAILTRSASMYAIFSYIEAVAKSPAPVLITGESGTGKELIARAVHTASDRPGPFTAVNVSGVDDTMFSDTLFGHRAGAYTGADRPRGGLIRRAEAGTLFLDEIGDLQTASQLKLLRLLQEQEFYPLGSDAPETARVRIIAATNSDLGARQADGRFRRDLYYRLSAHHIHVPPLRDRPADIPLLVDHFVRQAAEQIDTDAPRVEPDALRLLEQHPFPGNVRELESILRDATSLARAGVIGAELLKGYVTTVDRAGAARYSDTGGAAERESAPGAHRDGTAPVAIGDRFPTLDEVEEYLVKRALERCNGNQSAAARLLGISQSTLSRRLRRT